MIIMGVYVDVVLLRAGSLGGGGDLFTRSITESKGTSERHLPLNFTNGNEVGKIRTQKE